MATLTGISKTSGVSNSVITEINDNIDDLTDVVSSESNIISDVSTNLLSLTGVVEDVSTNLLSLSNATFNSSLANGTTVQGSFGGLVSGTNVSVLKTKTLDQIFDMMFFPTQNPDIEYPNGSALSITGGHPSGTKTIGSSHTYTIDFTTNTNYNKVTPVTGSVIQPYSGFMLEAQYKNFGDSNWNDFTLPSSSTNWRNVNATSSITKVVAAGDNGKIQVRVRYDNGTYQPVDSLNNNFGSPYSSSSTFYEKDGSTLTGVYPRFYNNENLSNGVQQVLIQGVDTTTNSIGINQNYAESDSTGVKHGWEIPNLVVASHNWSVQLYDPIQQVYNTLDSSEFTTSSITKTIEGNTVDYTRWRKQSSEQGASLYRLQR